ncbi:MAG: 9-O-acetylesterase [Cyclobacteriaceae bacterium]|nr:MAG: 9-O-acetylesterase [Cyclobacteriaceae bacterium]
MLRYWLFAFILVKVFSAFARLELPRLLSHGAILQHSMPLTLRGHSLAHEQIIVTLKEDTFSVVANAQGEWRVNLPPQAPGGPYHLYIKGQNEEIVVQNILFGDVWICSGQSNMELTVERVKEKYSHLIAQAYNPFIRHFDVPDRYDFKTEHKDLAGGEWKEATPVNVLSFSAVAWFFACEIYSRHKIPVGLINASLGGSPAEAWMSEDALKNFSEAWQELQRFKNDDLIKEIENANAKNAGDWYAQLNATDAGLRQWHRADLNDTDWPVVTLPAYWPNETALTTGSVWLRKEIHIPQHMCGKAGSLWLGRIVDADSVFVNDVFVGSTSYQYPPRRYTFGPGVLKPGRNIISVRVINSSGKGGFVPDKPYFLAVETDTLSLAGPWKYRQGCIMPPQPSQVFIRWKPAGLYNGMIAPLTSLPVKGVIWYQGEANTHRPGEYFKIFPALINNWRDKWNQGDFPFLFVQLANFMEPKANPSESNWALTRQAQLETLKRVPNAAMAVTIDVGEWNDIHPADKYTVGYRLALAARHVAYGEVGLVFSGPLYESHQIRRKKIIITFSNTGSGLTANDNQPLRYFSIAGANKKFVWARARIKDNKVVVWNNAVSRPVAVRYAWADNPEGANLYNKEGLPASPFTTEQHE